MDNLTATELKTLNNISRSLNPEVSLGNKLQEIIGVVGETGTPVNAVAATATLGITGVCIDGETFTIGDDTYEFLADAAQTKTSASNIAVDITSKTVKASGTLTVDTQPTSGDTLTIGSKTYIFVPFGTANADGEISIGADLAGAQDAIVAAINGTDGVNTANASATAAAFADNASTITALIGGTVGNTIPTTETFTAETNVFAATTLGSGTNCTAANTSLVVIAAVNANTNSGVTASAGDGNNVLLTADVAGTIGNAIEISETMANAAFDNDTTALNGGIDGTIASGMKIMVDETYMYVCLDGNTTADKNWRRVALGAAY